VLQFHSSPALNSHCNFDNQLPQEQSEQGLFDFEQIPEEKRPFVLQKTAETQWLLKRSSDDIFKIGKNLLDVKATLPHGMFQKWIKSEFGMSYTSANRFMIITRKLETKSPTMGDLGMGMNDLLELASAPDEVIDQVVVGVVLR